MIKSYHLQAVAKHVSPLSFNWDSETGTLSGKDAQAVQEMVTAAVKQGFTSLVPPPNSYDIDDPLTKPDQMSAVLGFNWQLPDDLQAAYPQLPEEPVIEVLDDNGAVVDTVVVLQ